MDNVGEIFLSQNSTTGQQTKHIDIWCNDACDEKKIIEIEFVSTVDNEASTQRMQMETTTKGTVKFMTFYERVKIATQLEAQKAYCPSWHRRYQKIDLQYHLCIKIVFKQ